MIATPEMFKDAGTAEAYEYVWPIKMDEATAVEGAARALEMLSNVEVGTMLVLPISGIVLVRTAVREFVWRGFTAETAAELVEDPCGGRARFCVAGFERLKYCAGKAGIELIDKTGITDAIREVVRGEQPIK